MPAMEAPQFEEPPAEAVAEQPSPYQAFAEQAAEAVAEQPAPAEPASEPAEPAAPLAEPPAEPSTELAAETVHPGPVRTTPADLKARIEETRRRIRRELAHPFSGEEEPAASEGMFGEPEAPVFAAPEAEPVLDLAPAASVQEEAAAEVPLAEPPGFDALGEAALEFAEEAVEAYDPAELAPTAEEHPEVSEPALETAPASGAGVAALAARIEPDASGGGSSPAEDQAGGPSAVEEERAPATLVAALPGGGFDQDAMRRRIEETRNRLKAKAFDAMMSGEGSLLRESTADAPEAPVVTVDTDVDATIETALTEEDF
jgi:nicotinate-nucleotide--dimethylbenzimidazole phosphoribosyltransferase